MESCIECGYGYYVSGSSLTECRFCHLYTQWEDTNIDVCEGKSFKNKITQYIYIYVYAYIHIYLFFLYWLKKQ